MLKILLMISSPLLISIFNSKKNYMNWPMTIMTLMIASFLGLATMYPQMNSPMTLTPISSMDPMSIMLTMLTIWISLLMMMASYKIMTTNYSPNLFILVLLSLMMTLYLCFNMNNYILFYIFFEASLIPTLLMITIWGYQPERLQAGNYLMLYTVTASLPLLLTLLLMNSYNYSMTMILPFPLVFPISQKMIFVWWSISILAFLVKMPIFFTHLWLPKAHVEAPVAGSMILAGILLKLGSYGLLRMTNMFPFLTNKINSLFAPLCMWGAVLTSMICLRQPDLKALIAYSSVGHMGLLTAGLMTCNNWGWSGTLTMMLAHGLCSSALFLLANMTYSATNTRSLILTKGLLAITPMMTMWWFIFLAINMAAPPSMNLLGEIMLITSILSISSILLIPLAILSFLGGAYSLHLYMSTQHGNTNLITNPLNLQSHSNFTQLVFHLTPLILTMLKAEIIALWIS